MKSTPSSVVEKLPNGVCVGDWHDRPLHWLVRTGLERQLFATRRDASLYAQCRRMAGTEHGAIQLFLSDWPEINS